MRPRPLRLVARVRPWVWAWEKPPVQFAELMRVLSSLLKGPRGQERD